jgi:transposase
MATLMPSPRIDRLDTPNDPAIRFREVNFGATWFTQLLRPTRLLAKTVLGHRELILNYFRAKKQFSSGVIEGLNNKAKLTMRKAYGF